MIDFLTSPIAETAAARPAVLWVLGITLTAIIVVLLRDVWRWFITLGKADSVLEEAGLDGTADGIDEVEEVRAVAEFVPAFERRNPTNMPTGFGRRRADGVGMMPTSA